MKMVTGKTTSPRCCWPARSRPRMALRRRRPRWSRRRRRKARSSGTRRSTSRSRRRSPRFFARTIPISDRGRALGIGARVPAHQPGVPVEHQERRRREFVRRVAFHFLEAAEVAGASHAARRASVIPAQFKDPEGYFAVWRATLERHGLQHQPRPAAKTRRPDMPTCSTRNGKASWPNRTRATAARA